MRAVYINQTHENSILFVYTNKGYEIIENYAIITLQTKLGGCYV